MRRTWTSVLLGLSLVAGQTITTIGGESAAAATTATPIQHVVVIYSENRSFDSYFGTYPNALNPPGEPKFVPKPDTPQVNGLTPDLLQHNPNQVNPFRIDPLRDGVFTCSQNHNYAPEQRAAHGGLMDQFVQATGKKGAGCLPNGGIDGGQVMGYFDGNTVTGLWNYAQNFALSDNFFGTTYGPSTPGALNLVAGTNAGATVPQVGQAVRNSVVVGDPDPQLDDCSTNANKATMTGQNVGDLLNKAGVTWGWFEGGFTRTTSNLDFCKKESTNRNGQSDEDYEPHHEPFQYWPSTANPHHLPPTSTAMIGKTDQANHQYGLGDFWDSLDNHTMPAVSYLKAPGYQDGHPGLSNSDPLDEQEFIVSSINRIERSDAWPSTAIIIAYDDSDGLYDHVFPPNVHHSNDSNTGGGTGQNVPRDVLYPGDTCMGIPAPPSGTKVYLDRCGYGPRVPMLVISPYAKSNFVDHTLTDQSSILKFIEDNWNLGRIGNDSFDAEAGSMLNMFDFDHPHMTPLILDPQTGEPGPPVINSVDLPSAPRTNDTISATVNASDPNGASLSLGYKWEKNNGAGWETLTNESASTLDLSQPGNGDKGDLIRVTVSINNGDEDGQSVTSAPVTVANTPSKIDLDPSSRTVDYSDPIDSVAVTASDADGDPLALSASGLPSGVSLADAGDGTGTIDGTVTGASGNYTAQVSASDGTDTTSTPLSIDVSKEQASVIYTGSLLVSTGSTSATSAPVNLRAAVLQQDDGSPGDLSKASVIFDLFSGNNFSATPDRSISAPVTADGIAAVQANVATGDWTVRVRFDPANGYFTGPASDQVVFTVYQPSADSFATGGGWIWPSQDVQRHANFGFTAKYRKTGDPTGHLTYIFRGSDGYDYLVKSNSWQTGGLAINPSRATLAGKASIIVMDPDTGQIVLGLGGGNYSYRADAVDGDQDAFAISVYAPSGALYHRAGLPSTPIPLGGGNVVIHGS